MPAAVAVGTVLAAVGSRKCKSSLLRLRGNPRATFQTAPPLLLFARRQGSQPDSHSAREIRFKRRGNSGAGGVADAKQRLRSRSAAGRTLKELPTRVTAFMTRSGRRRSCAPRRRSQGSTGSEPGWWRKGQRRSSIARRSGQFARGTGRLGCW
jgi:hypothetical protein